MNNSKCERIITTVVNKTLSENPIAILIGVVIAIFISLLIVFTLTKKYFLSVRKLNIGKNEYGKRLEQQKKQFENELELIEKHHLKEKQALFQKIKSEAELYKIKIQDLEMKIEALNKENGELKEIYYRIQMLYPDIDFKEEVYQMKEKEYKDSASEIDKKISNCIQKPADKDNIEEFRQVLEYYNTIEESVKKYVTADIEKLQSLHEESIKLLEAHDKVEQEKRNRESAQKAYEEIKVMFLESQNQSLNMYDTLKIANDTYEKLSLAEKSFFPDKKMIKSIKDALKEAEKDKANLKIARHAERQITAILDTILIAGEEDKNKLDMAMGCYRNLSDAQKRYFSDELLEKLYNQIQNAQNNEKEKNKNSSKKY